MEKGTDTVLEAAGPDRKSLLTCRSYFVVDVEPREGQAPGPERFNEVLERIDEERKRRYPPKTPGDQDRVTDVYVSCHGWHRNLYRGMSAYDRLASRLTLLHARGRLKLDPEEPYRPLHVSLHWNSDIDEDGWVDLDGRKTRESFVKAACAAFERKDGDQAKLIDWLEDVYQYFVKTSAPEIAPLEKPIEEDGKDLLRRMGEVDLAQARSAAAGEKATALWRCYHEGERQAVAQEQRQPARSYAGPKDSLMRLLSFVLRVAVGLAGIGFVLGPARGAIRWLLGTVGDWSEPIVAWLRNGDGGVGGLGGYLSGGELEALGWGLAALALYMVAYVPATAYLGWAGSQNRGRRKEREAARAKRRGDGGGDLSPQTRTELRAHPLNVLGIVAWAVMQVGHLLPVLLFCGLSYPHPYLLIPVWAALIVYGAATHAVWAVAFVVVPWILIYMAQWHQMEIVFDERSGDRGKGPDEAKIPRYHRSFRVWLTYRFAGWPARLAQAADAPESRAYGLWDTVLSLLGILEMQVKAVDVARHARDFVDGLQRREGFEGVRVHLIGHSFGGVVVMNLARELAARKDGPPLESVTTMMGAFGSDWLGGEDALRKGVRGCVAALYTQYDTATGAIFSLFNGGRNGCGAVGLSPVRRLMWGTALDWVQRRGAAAAPSWPVYPLPSASLSQPPDLRGRLRLAGQTVPEPGEGAILNVDVSRLCFEGPPAAGGAHGDVFKSEVIHTLWSVAHYRQRAGIERERPTETVVGMPVAKPERGA